MVDQFKEAFKEETSDIIASLNNLLVDLEVDSSNEENKILLFRYLHTIKGGAGMFGYNKMASLVHDIETILDPYKQGDVPHISPEVTSLLLSCMDYLSFLMDTDEGQSDDFEQKKISLISSLSHAFEGELGLENFSQTSPSSPEVKEEEIDFLFDESLGSTEDVNFYRIDILLSEDYLFTGNRPHFLFNDLSELGDLKSFANTTRIPILSELDTGKLYINWIVILASLAEKELVEDVFLFLMGDSKAIIQNLLPTDSELIERTIDDIVRFNFRREEVMEILSSSDLLKPLVKGKTISSSSIIENTQGEIDFIEIEEESPEVKVIPPTIPLKEKEVKEAPSFSPPIVLPTTSSSVGNNNGVAVQRIRVDSRRLDSLVDLVGELVTIQARLSQKLKEGNYNEMENIAEKLDFIVQELRDITTGMRMIPIQGTFAKFQRLVRDLSQELGKKVNYITEGGDTEIDKNIIEKLDEPLVHLIRNSLDHGIESPEERLAEGKPETAFVRISAQQNGANISIIIQDDGAGISRDAVGKKAVERGLVSSYEDLSDEEVYNFIFAPGFSTASQVTNLSGRGVGLNVVKSQVESLRGNINVKSEKGKGTTFSLVFPLTLAIIDGFLIRVGLEYFIIPLVNVEACLEMKRTDFQKLKTEQGGFMAFREKVIPFIELRDLFEIKDEFPESQQVVIVQSDQTMIGIFVDEVIGKHQTVIKSLGEIYRNAKGVSSATILGDGSIALLLDVEAIVDMHAATDLAKEITLEELKAFTQEINLGEYPLINLVIIDDSALVRRAISYCFEEDSDVSIVGIFPSPIDAIKQIPTLNPDVIICDIEMPGMNGLDFLRTCSENRWRIPVIICSAQVDNPELAMQAYSLGAIDVLLKPDMSTPKVREESKGIFRRIVRLAYQSRNSLKFPSIPAPAKSSVQPTPVKQNINSSTTPKISSTTPVRRIIVLGSSTGGPEAVKSVLRDLPSEMPPILIVQHMPQGFTKLFADTLNRISSLTVLEAKGGEVLKNNHVYVAPGNKQMGLVRKMSEYIIKIEDADLMNGHRPSVDYLFFSVAKVNALITTAIILTGMGNDGAGGIKLLKEMGSPLTIAQNEETCVVYGMPKEAIATGKVDKILPLQEISPFLVKSVK